MPADALPQRWQDRALDVRLVALLPEEAADILAGGSAHPLLADEDTRLARLVAEGLTNTAIARRLDVDPRTVQRRVTALCERLDVSSKAELAVLLAARGLADDGD